MAARMVKGPPRCGQMVRSMSNTRLSNWAQLMRACDAGVGAARRLGLGGHNLRAQGGVGGEHAMEANEMEAGPY